jgi:hypothetical protein
MTSVLLNLALIHLNQHCQDHGVPISGSHVVKVGRGFRYALVSSDTGATIVTVTFHKSQVPTFTKAEGGAA